MTDALQTYSEAPRRAISASDFLGTLAKYAVEQHPYHRPEGLFDLIDRWAEVLRPAFGDLGVKMLTLDAVREHGRWLLIDHPECKAWNTPRSGHNRLYGFVTATSRPAPEDDFIDIDALVRNVTGNVWRLAEHGTDRPVHGAIGD